MPTTDWPTSPDCTAHKHRTQKAHKDAGCVCPGATWDAYQRYLETERQKRRDRYARSRATAADNPDRFRLDRGLPNDRKHEERFPAVPAPTHDADDAERAFYQRDDLQCRDFDPELWFPVGTGPEAKRIERAARSICGNCTAQRACLSVALARNDIDHGVIGGYNPAERRRMVEFAKFGVAS